MDASKYLSDIEKKKLESFNEDEVMKEAVRKVLLEGVYYNGTLKPDEKADPLTNFALTFHHKGSQIPQTDEDIGRELRAWSWALDTLESAFEEIAKYTKENKLPPKPKKNLAK